MPQKLPLQCPQPSLDEEEGTQQSCESWAAPGRAMVRTDQLSLFLHMRLEGDSALCPSLPSSVWPRWQQAGTYLPGRH